MALTQDFEPIMEELKQDFFSLPPQELNALLKSYGLKYGESAAIYAEKSYPNWKDGSVRMSAQTLMRLIQDLPYFLTGQQKISLAQKLLEFYYKKMKYDSSVHRVNATWENFDLEINKTIIEIQKSSWKDNLRTKWEKIIPEQVQELASWIYDDDVLIVKKIIEEFITRKIEIAIANGINDLDKFRWQCRWMLERGYIYEDAVLVVNLPDTTIRVIVHRAKKNIFQRIADLF